MNKYLQRKVIGQTHFPTTFAELVATNLPPKLTRLIPHVSDFQ